MKKSTIFSSLAALAISLGTNSYATTAMTTNNSAAPDQGSWYATISGGWAYLQNQDVGFYDYNEHPGGGEYQTYKTGGWNAGLSIGKMITSSLRAEFQTTYTTSDMNKVHGYNVSNSQNQNAVWYGINTLYDFHLNSNSKVIPYIGAGLGGLTVTTDYKGQQIGPDYISPNSTTDTQPAYQGIIGLGYQATKHLRISAEYRRLSSFTQVKVIDSSQTAGDDQGTTVTGKSFYNNNLFNLGITYFF